MLNLMNTAELQIKMAVMEALGRCVAEGLLPPEPIPSFAIEVPGERSHGASARVACRSSRRERWLVRYNGYSVFKVPVKAFKRVFHLMSFQRAFVRPFNESFANIFLFSFFARFRHFSTEVKLAFSPSAICRIE